IKLILFHQSMSQAHKSWSSNDFSWGNPITQGRNAGRSDGCSAVPGAPATGRTTPAKSKTFLVTACASKE
ncbi:hypothetical protein, partial [Photobacterium sp. R1]